MQKNRKSIVMLVMAVSLILIVIMAYPVVDEQIHGNQKGELFLDQALETSSPDASFKDKAAELPQDTDPGEPFPEITLSLNNDTSDFHVTLWQSDAGTCYFFLPGFARDMGLILKDNDHNTICINDVQIQETDVLLGISEETSYDLSVMDPEGNILLHRPLLFMYSSSLPVMALTTKSGNLEYINADKSNEEPGAAVLFDEDGESLYTGSVKAIRGRGNSTWGLSKKPYQIKLHEETDFFGFGQADSWNLIANGYDQTKLRNQIATELATELGMDFVPEGQMIDLYINHTYYGNYYLTEKIRVDEYSVDIKDMDTYVNDAYDTRELAKLERLENEDGTRKWVATDISPDDISGGYLLERELAARFETQDSGFITAQGDCYTLQSPAYASQSQVDYIADLMQEFQDAVMETDGIHPVTGRHYSEYIDMDSFAQKYLVEEISKNYDGGVTSSFFYKPDDSVSEKIYAGPIWDYDVAFGNCNLDRIASNPIGITKLHNHVYGTEIFAQLYEQEDFYHNMVTMYQERALPYLNDLLDYKLEEMVAQSRASVAMDRARWETPENRYQYYQEYDNSVKFLKHFIEQRRDFLNEVWLEGVSYHNLSFVVDDEIWQIYCIEDGALPPGEPVPIRYSSPSLFMGWFSENGVPYDMYKPIYEDMTFYATWQELTVQTKEGDGSP